MELLIKDFAKIKYAKIKCNGITVIAGDNNTGKSTIGKILWSTFNSTFNLDQKINAQREHEIYSILNRNFRNIIMRKTHFSFDFKKNPSELAKVITEELLNSDKTLSHEELTNIFKSNLDLTDSADDEISQIIDKINAIVMVQDEKVKLEVISRYYSDVFSKQINNISNESSKAMVELTIKNQKIELSFLNNLCEKFNAEYDIMHNAFYVDNPFILDELNTYLPIQNIIRRHIISSLTHKNDDIMEGIFETVSAKEKLNEINKILENVVDGEIIENQNGEYSLNSSKLNKPILINNLSTGLKSFVIIKMLIEKGILKEKDVLILDEPEIHLHPQWQTYYAEIIVLLQKYFDLTIIITTHSPYFLDAIEVFSAKHKISNAVNYYLSENDTDNTVKVNDVTDNIEEIYKKLAAPMQELENLRNRIENYGK